jgi:hypothetical protein
MCVCIPPTGILAKAADTGVNRGKERESEWESERDGEGVVGEGRVREDVQAAGNFRLVSPTCSRMRVQTFTTERLLDILVLILLILLLILLLLVVVVVSSGRAAIRTQGTVDAKLTASN